MYLKNMFTMYLIKNSRMMYFSTKIEKTFLRTVKFTDTVTIFGTITKKKKMNSFTFTHLNLKKEHVLRRKHFFNLKSKYFKIFSKGS